MVFDKPVTEKTIASNLERLEVAIIEDETTTPLTVKNERIETDQNRKVCELDIEAEELNSVSLKITSKIRESRRRRVAEEDNKETEKETKKFKETEMFTVIIEGVSYLKLPNLDTYTKLGQGASMVINGLVIVCLVVSLPSALILMNISQMINFIRFIDLDYPANLLAFTDGFSKNIFTLIPNLIPAESSTGCSMQEVFYRAEYSCIGLQNNGGALILIVAFLAISLVATFALKPKEGDTIGELVQRLLSIRTLNFILLMTQKDMMMAAFTRMASLGLGEAVLDTGLQFVVVLLYVAQLVYSSFIAFIGFKVKKDENEKNKRKGEEPKCGSIELSIDLTAHLDTDKNKLSLLDLPLISITNFALPALILMTVENPSSTPVSIILVYSILALYVALIRPSKSGRINLFRVVVNLAGAGAAGMLMMIKGTQDHSEGGLTEGEKHSRVGVPVVIILVLAVILGCGNALGSLLEYIHYFVWGKAKAKQAAEEGNITEKDDQQIEKKNEVPKRMFRAKPTVLMNHKPGHFMEAVNAKPGALVTKKDTIVENKEIESPPKKQKTKKQATNVKNDPYDLDFDIPDEESSQNQMAEQEPLKAGNNARSNIRNSRAPHKSSMKMSVVNHKNWEEWNQSRLPGLPGIKAISSGKSPEKNEKKVVFQAKDVIFDSKIE